MKESFYAEMAIHGIFTRHHITKSNFNLQLISNIGKICLFRGLLNQELQVLSDELRVDNSSH